jgi:hypothetical protein
MTNQTPSQNFETAKKYASVLSYEEKIYFRDWLESEINKGMADHTKEKAKEAQEKLGSFIDKAASITKTAGNSLKNSFNGIFNKEEGK